MTAKSVLVRPQGLRPRALAPTFTTPLPERQLHKAVRIMAARNKHCKKLTSRRIRTCGN